MTHSFWARSMFVCLVSAMLAQAQPASLPAVLNRTGLIRSETVALPALSTGHQYSVLNSAASLSGLGPAAGVRVEVVQGDALLAGKTLHSGDADFYTQLRVPATRPAQVRITSNDASGQYSFNVNRRPLSDAVRRRPNHRWQDAMEITLGETLFASGDDAPYISQPDTPCVSVVEDPVRTD